MMQFGEEDKWSGMPLILMKKRMHDVKEEKKRDDSVKKREKSNTQEISAAKGGLENS